SAESVWSDRCLAAIELHSAAILAGDNPEAIIFDLRSHGNTITLPTREETPMRLPAGAKYRSSALRESQTGCFFNSLLMRIPNAANRFRLADRCDVSQAVSFRNEVTLHHGGAMPGKREKLGVGLDYRQGRAAGAHRVQLGKQGCVRCREKRRSC